MKPNIIYILADDMGYGDMKCNNPESKIPTPNLDLLAEKGIRFTNAHAGSSVCTPSRYHILTGNYCWRTPLQAGVLWPWDRELINKEDTTVPSFLKKHGYNTACFGKWHLGWNWQTKDGEACNKGIRIGEFGGEYRHKLGENIDFTKPVGGGPTTVGFDYYFGGDVPNFPPYTWIENDRIVDQPTEEKPDEMFGLAGKMAPGWKLEEEMPETVKRAIDYIQESDSNPFFLFLSLTGPHTPIVPLKKFQGSSGAGEYGDFVVEVDSLVGDVMNALDEKGISENTMVIFTSDNGPETDFAGFTGAYKRMQDYDHASMHHFRGVKRDVWEGGHRVPYILRWPALCKGGTVCDDLISLGDLLATCADYMEDTLPRGWGLDSVSFLPILKGESGTREYAIHHAGNGIFAIRHGDWVLLDSQTPDNNHEPDWFKERRGYTPHNMQGELYNLREDVSEKNNLFDKHPEIVKKLQAILDEERNHSAFYIDDSAQSE